MVPTPAVARAVVKEKAALGVVITASHNPAADNGIKFFGAGGVKLTDEDELAIEALLPAAPTEATLSIPLTTKSGAAQDYVAHARGLLDARSLASVASNSRK